MRYRCLNSLAHRAITFQAFLSILVGCASAGSGEEYFIQGEYSENSMCEPMTAATCECPNGFVGTRLCLGDGTMDECNCSGENDINHLAIDSGIEISISSSTNALDMTTHRSNGAGWEIEDDWNSNLSTSSDGSQNSGNPFDTNTFSSFNSCPASFLCEENSLLNILFHDLHFCTKPELYLFHGLVGATPPSCSSTNECSAMGFAGTHCIGLTDFGIAYCLSTCSP